MNGHAGGSSASAGLFLIIAGRGWVPCDPDAPGAQPDINWLYAEAEWEPIAGRWKPKVKNPRQQVRLVPLGLDATPAFT